MTTTEEPTITRASHCACGTGVYLFTSDLVNALSGRMRRRGGASVALRLRQDALNPFSEITGNASPPLVQAEVLDAERHRPLDVLFTTGQARSLAAMLVALADRAEIERG